MMKLYSRTLNLSTWKPDPSRTLNLSTWTPIADPNCIYLPGEGLLMPLFGQTKHPAFSSEKRSSRQRPPWSIPSIKDTFIQHDMLGSDIIPVCYARLTFKAHPRMAVQCFMYPLRITGRDIICMLGWIIPTKMGVSSYDKSSLQSGSQDRSISLCRTFNKRKNSGVSRCKNLSNVLIFKIPCDTTFSTPFWRLCQTNN